MSKTATDHKILPLQFTASRKNNAFRQEVTRRKLSHVFFLPRFLFLRLRLDPQHDSQLISSDVAKRHLSKMNRKDPLSLIAIFGKWRTIFGKTLKACLKTFVGHKSGSARQGKSFLMNKLAGGAGCGFRVSNLQDPCTVGVDLCANTVRLSDFCSVEGSAKAPAR